MSDIADLAFEAVSMMERPQGRQVNQYVVAVVRGRDTELKELRCTASDRDTEMLKQFGINVRRHTSWAVGLIAGNTLALCGRSDKAKAAIRATHPGLRLSS